MTCDEDEEIFVRRNMEQVDTVLKMIHKYPEDFQLVTTAQGKNNWRGAYKLCEGKVGQGFYKLVQPGKLQHSQINRYIITVSLSKTIDDFSFKTTLWV